MKAQPVPFGLLNSGGINESERFRESPGEIQAEKLFG
jgi:hypothetical protein